MAAKSPELSLRKQIQASVTCPQTTLLSVAPCFTAKDILRPEFLPIYQTINID